jgi:hypothetical protein
METAMAEEDFLKRWSRRKREVAKVEVPPAVAPAPVDQAAKSDQTVEAEFDPSTLPLLESINALTDVTAFLRAGVPADLTRAALRRVWTADPSIRDFVGLAENAWDFTDPSAMPGFGPLEMTDEVRRMIASLVDKIGEAAKPDAEDFALPEMNSSHSSGITDDNRSVEAANARDLPAPPAKEISRGRASLQSNEENTAAQHVAADDRPDPAQLTRRTHGGALPR